MPLLTPIQIASLTSRIIAKSLAAGATSSILEQATVATADKIQSTKITAFVDTRTSESISKQKNNFTSHLKDQLDQEIIGQHESFSQLLLRKIREKGMDNAECYTKANVDRRVFSKIISNNTYRPKKRTIISFAIALELSLDETKELLMKAELALSDNVNFDLIIKHFITNQIYDFFLINEVLLEYEQPLLNE
ncbi:MAG: hypothetical protein IJE96_08145 [Mailhella sp.]|nr:hypothetical protein [Mailhella sp.]